MSPEARTALAVGSVGLVAAGAALLFWPRIRQAIGGAPGGCTPPPGVPTPLKWPCSKQEAEATLLSLSTLWWNNIGNEEFQNQLHAEAEAIRKAFPGAGPEGGYTCEELVAKGIFTPSYCSYARALLEQRAKQRRPV